MDEPACECPGPGFCKRYSLDQGEYAWRLCANNCTQEAPCNEKKSQRYRLKWRLQKEAADRGEVSPATLPVVRNPRTPPPKPAPVEEGLGTEVMLLLESLGIKAKSCRCKERKYKMNAWGLDECERRKGEIVSWLREEQAKISEFAKMKAVILGVKEILSFRMAPPDPRNLAESVFSEALRRAREKQQREAKDGGTS